MKQDLSHQEVSFFLGLFFISVIAVGLVLYSTVWGAGLISDSFQYIASAQNLVHSGFLGFPYGSAGIVPLTQYPPFLSILLAGLIALGAPALVAIRILNALLLGLNVLLAGVLARRLTGSAWVSIVVGALVGFSYIWINIHAWALSEPLYLFLGLAAFLAISYYLERRSWPWLLAGSVFSGLAFLTRYAGLALVISGAMILVACQKSWKLRLRDLATLLAASLAPVGFWTLRNLRLTATLNNRSLEFAPVTAKNWLAAANTALSWFFPPQFVTGREKFFLFLAILLLVGLAAGLLWITRKGFEQGASEPLRNPLFGLFTIYGLMYGGLLLISKLYFDPNIGFSDRLMSPVYLASLFVLSAVLAIFWQSGLGIFRFVAVSAAAYLLFLALAGSYLNLPHLHKQGLGIARKSWHESQAIRTLSSLDPQNIYSNSLSSVYLWRGQTGFTLQDFEDQLVDPSGSPEYLVIFHHVASNPRIQRLSAGLPVLVDDKVATIYTYSP